MIEAIGAANSKIILGITEDKLLKVYQKKSDEKAPGLDGIANKAAKPTVVDMSDVPSKMKATTFSFLAERKQTARRSPLNTANESFIKRTFITRIHRDPRERQEAKKQHR